MWQFWKNRKDATVGEGDHAYQTRLAEFDARITCIGAVAFGVLQHLSEEQRNSILAAAKVIVGQHIGERSPKSVPEAYHSTYRNELNRTFQVFTEMGDHKPQSN